MVVLQISQTKVFMNDNYPPGLENHPDAPYNYNQDELEDVDDITPDDEEEGLLTNNILDL